MTLTNSCVMLCCVTARTYNSCRPIFYLYVCDKWASEWTSWLSKPWGWCASVMCLFPFALRCWDVVPRRRGVARGRRGHAPIVDGKNWLRWHAGPALFSKLNTVLSCVCCSKASSLEGRRLKRSSTFFEKKCTLAASVPQCKILATRLHDSRTLLAFAIYGRIGPTEVYVSKLDGVGNQT